MFGLIQGFIGRIVKLLGRAHGNVVLRNADTEADIQPESIVVKRMRPHILHKFLDEQFGLRGIRVIQHDAEFVAPQTRGLIGLADMQAQKGADITQYLIPGAMTMAVVDQLEVVDVEQHQGDLFRETLGLMEHP